MIKINLVSKKSRSYKSRDWTKTIALLIFGVFGIYFLGVTLYVVITMSSVSTKISKAKAESEAISAEMLRNNDKLSRFILTKLILTKITEINKQKFHYKDYLDQLSLLLPAGSTLTSVGFATKGWIDVSVVSDDIASFESLEKTLLNKDTWTESKYFSSAYVDGVTKDKLGVYSSRLHFELKK